MTGPTTLLVFSDDWGRHPSSCQHLVGHLLDHFEVIWVNTIGTRRPRLNADTLQRGAEKLRSWTKGRDESPVRLTDRAPRVLSPIMLPWFGSRLSRAVNRALILKQLTRAVPNLGSSVVLTTLPITADLVDGLPARRWVYYCVDDFSQWPGLDAPTLRAMEDQLIGSVDTIVAAGENLARRIRQRGRQPVVISHGIDLNHWVVESGTTGDLPELALIERPVIMYWGLIDRRLDVAWLRALGERMPTGTLVLIGPQQDPDPALVEVPRLHLTGPLPYDRLPLAAAASDVLIMPYADLPVTQAIQPLKLKEYLATGKPVVMRRLPSSKDWEDCLFAVDSEVEFVDSVLSCTTGGPQSEHEKGRARLQEEEWSSKAQALRLILESSSSTSNLS